MKLLSLILVISFFLTSQFTVFAGEVPKTLPTKLKNNSISVSTKLSKDKQTVIATFSNLKDVKIVNYTLMYEANGIGEGVIGSIKPTSNKSITKNIYLGTCSGRVCRPHKKIKNMLLQLTGEYKNKKKINQTIKVKI